MRQLGVALLVVTMLMLAGCATPAGKPAEGATANATASPSPTPPTGSPATPSPTGPVYTVTKYFELGLCTPRWHDSKNYQVGNGSDGHCYVIHVHLNNTRGDTDEGGDTFGLWSVVTGDGTRIWGEPLCGKSTAVAGFATDFEMSFPTLVNSTILRLGHGPHSSYGVGHPELLPEETTAPDGATAKGACENAPRS